MTGQDMSWAISGHEWGGEIVKGSRLEWTKDWKAVLRRTFRSTQMDADRLHHHRMRSSRHRRNALDEISPLGRKRTDGRSGRLCRSRKDRAVRNLITPKPNRDNHGYSAWSTTLRSAILATCPFACLPHSEALAVAAARSHAFRDRQLSKE